jgi:hypothetical protein
MTWPARSAILSRLGYKNFESEEEFDNWFNWELDDKDEEKRIRNAFKKECL